MIIEMSSTTLYSIYEKYVNEEEPKWEVKFRHQNKSVIDHHLQELRNANINGGFIYRLVSNKEILCKENTAGSKKFTRIIDTIIESDISEEINQVLSDYTLN